MAKIAENGQNNEIFVVVSSQMPKGRNILCQETIIWCSKTKEIVSGPLGAHERGREWLKTRKNEKIQAILDSFYLEENNLPNYLCRYCQPVQQK